MILTKEQKLYVNTLNSHKSKILNTGKTFINLKFNWNINLMDTYIIASNSSVHFV